MKKFNIILSSLFFTLVSFNSFSQTVQVDWLAGHMTGGQASTASLPGGLEHSMGWYDGGNFIWLYGGNGPTQPNGNSDELWKYNISLNTWTEIGTGSSSYTKRNPNYGLNIPGSRSYANWWQSGGYFYFFGGGNGDGTYGSGYNDFVEDCYADLWRFDPTANAGNGEWVFIKGHQGYTSSATLASGLHNGTYGTKLVGNINNNPPNREKAFKWVDNNGDLWLYGGFTGRPEDRGYSDMWKYDISANQWTWMQGDSGLNNPKVTTAGPLATPGARGEGLNWTDSNGNLWLYGGFINATSYADLWMYNVTNNQWTIVDNNPNGSSPNGSVGVEYNVSDNTNHPGTRYSGWNWVQDGYLFLAYSNGNSNGFEDIWRFNPYCSSWTRIAVYPSGTLYNTAGGAGNHLLPRSHGSWMVQINDSTVYGFAGFTQAYSGNLADISRIVVPSSLNPILTTTSVSAVPSSICNGSSTTLTAVGCGNGTSVRWYSNSGLSTLVSTSNPVSVSPSSSTTYYPGCYNPSTGCVVNIAQHLVSVSVSTPPTAPTGVNASPTSGCVGYSSTLSGTCATGSIRWYNSSTGTGAGLSSPLTVNSAQTVYARCFNGSNPAGCQYGPSSAGINLTVSTTPLAPTGVSASPTSGCVGYSSTLSGTCATGSIRWYNSSTGTGAGLSSPLTVNSAQTVYARCFNGSNPAGCQYGPSSAGINLTVSTTPIAPTGVSASPTSGCVGYSSTLSGTCATGSIRWYNSSTGTGAGLSSPLTVNSAQTVYARCFNGSNPAGCQYGPSSAGINLSVSTTPLAPTGVSASPTSGCVGYSSTLSGTCATGSIRWYNSSTGTGAGLSSPLTVNSAQTVYARCFNGSNPAGCQYGPSSAGINLTIFGSPGAPTSLTATPPSGCSGFSTTLGGTCGTGVIRWYTTLGGTGAGIGANQTVTANTTYYARCFLSTNSVGCQYSSSSSIAVTINNPPTPTGVAASPNVICEFDSTSLTGNCSTGTIQWFLDSNRVTSSNNRVSPTANTTYYAFCYSSSCYSLNWDSVGVLVNPRPLAPTNASLSSDTICPTGSAVLSATGCLGGNIEWYLDSLAAGVPLSSTTVSPITTTTYYAFCRENGCLSIGWDSVRLNVGDYEPPVFNCPLDVYDTLITDCEFTIPDYTVNINANDNCSGNNVVVNQFPLPGTIIDFRMLNSQTIRITVEDMNNNSDTCYFNVNISCEEDCIIPEFISPNGDGKNDSWIIECLSFYPNNNVKIFNRWGSLLYEKNNYYNEWEGQVNTSQLPLMLQNKNQVPSGTYFYLLDLYGDGEKIYTGYIQIRK